MAIAHPGPMAQLMLVWFAFFFFLVYWPFETVFQSISGRLLEKEREEKDRGE